MNDMILYNGKIYTMAAEGERFEAMAVVGGRVSELGSGRSILKKYGAGNARAVDLHGKTVLPGFIDSHMHLLAYCESRRNVDLRSACSIGELKELLRQRAEKTPPGKWIVGSGFDDEKFPDKKFPDKDVLDDVSRRHPVFVTRFCMHGHAANSMAMELAGLKNRETGPTENPAAAGRDGDPTGILWENAAVPVMRIIPDELSTYESKRNAIRRACRELSAFGITGITPIQGKECRAIEYLGIYQQLARSGELPVRVYACFDEMPPFDMRSGFGDDMVKYGFYKIYSDGSLGSHTAALFEPYADDPGNAGTLNHSPEEICRMVRKAYGAGLQIGIHAIGDRGLDIALTALEKAYFGDPRPNQRFRLIHAIVPTPSLIERMKKLPLILDVQPEFLSSDLDWIEKRLGKDRAKLSYPWGTYARNGLLMTGSSDSPVESFNPLLGIYSAVTRKDFRGNPEGGWNAAEKLSVYEAVSLFTRNAAYASYEEDRKGTLEPGKFADFAVLDSDIFHVVPEAIKEIEVKQTYLGGRLVFDGGNL